MANRFQKNKIIAGLDEAGRGPLAGPVVAAAITILKPCYKINILKKFPILIKPLDSKKISPQKREAIFEELKKIPGVFFSFSKVSAKVIDKINILNATKLAMKRAILNLEIQTNQKIDFLLIDGNFYLEIKKPQKPIIKGDEKHLFIKLASIVAKVVRDRTMKNYYHKKFPQYNFFQHKGYGTKEHLRKLKKFGPCEIHRKTFRPVKKRADTVLFLEPDDTKRSQDPLLVPYLKRTDLGECGKDQ